MEKDRFLRLITIFAVVFIALLAAALVINMVRLTGLNAKKRELAARLDEINEQIERNNSEIDYISTDDYIDQYAREYLNMQGKDEQAFTGR